MSKYRRYLLAVVVTVTMVGFTAPPATADPIDDPIPEQPIRSNIALTLRDFAQFPQSQPIPPPTDPRLMRRARINYIGQVPDGSGRYYVPDLNGKLYLLDRTGTPREYLDVAATFAPDFVSGRGLGTGFGFVAFHPEFAQRQVLHRPLGMGRGADHQAAGPDRAAGHPVPRGDR